MEYILFLLKILRILPLGVDSESRRNFLFTLPTKFKSPVLNYTLKLTTMDSVKNSNANGNDQYRGLLGQTFTEMVIKSMGPNTSPRMREVMALFIQHMHDFAREANLTVQEWMSAVDMVNWAGQMSNDRRNEGQLMCDIIGLESLVDDITYQAVSESSGSATASAILGPFWRETPIRENGSSISANTPSDGKLVFMHGRVTRADTGAPIANASVDLWQASTNGRYHTGVLMGPDVLTPEQVFTSNRTRISLTITFAVDSLRTAMESTASIVSGRRPTQ